MWQLSCAAGNHMASKHPESSFCTNKRGPLVYRTGESKEKDIIPENHEKLWHFYFTLTCYVG